MPTYAYACKSCKKTTLQAHSIKAIPQEIPCPCGAVAQKTYITPTGFVNGWTPPCTLDGKYSSGWCPQYGEYRDQFQLVGKEQKALQEMNAKQGSERWKVERSVLDGRTGSGTRGGGVRTKSKPKRWCKRLGV